MGIFDKFKKRRNAYKSNCGIIYSKKINKVALNFIKIAIED